MKKKGLGEKKRGGGLGPEGKKYEIMTQLKDCMTRDKIGDWVFNISRIM